MRVCVSFEERFRRTPDGRVWSGASGISGYAFWKRYLASFDHVTVIARVTDVPAAEAHWIEANGDGVSFHAVPYYVGPQQYARRYFSILRSIRSSIGESDAIVMRVPSTIACQLERRLAPGRPFALEVIGDPYEVLAPGAIRHPLRPFFRWRLTSRLQRQCRRAAAVAYVSGGALQQRYPARAGAFCSTYSSIELTDAAFVAHPRSILSPRSPLRIVSVGSLELPYKGFDTLIAAAAACRGVGLEVEVTIVGDGRCRPDMERYAQNLGIGDRIAFRGQVPRPQVREELDRADLFVLASKTEGLPRAMIEAMARALPCLGSAVGAIPELLDAEDLFERGDVAALARKIGAFAHDPGRMARASERNLEAARAYHSSILTARRTEFYNRVREITERWLEASSTFAHPSQRSAQTPADHRPLTDSNA